MWLTRRAGPGNQGMSSPSLANRPPWRSRRGHRWHGSRSARVAVGIGTLLGAIGVGVGVAAAPPLLVPLGICALAAPAVFWFLFAEPRWAAVALVGALILSVPDLLASQTPLPGEKAWILAFLLLIAGRRLAGHRPTGLPDRAYWLYALLLSLAVSGFVALHPGRTLEAIATETLNLALAIGLVMLIDTPAWLRRAVWAVVLAAAALATVGALHYATGGTGSAFFGLASVIDDHGVRRSAGPTDVNFFAQLLVTSAALAFYLWRSATERRERAAAFACLTALVIGAGLTQSRGSFLAFGVGGLVVVWLAATRPWARWALVVGAAAAALVVVPPQVGALLTSSDLSRESREQSVDTRLDLNRMAAKMFADQPLLGVGAGNYPERAPAYARELDIEQADLVGGGVGGDGQRPHSLYLERLAETGAVGTLALVLVILVALRSAWLGRRLGGSPGVLCEGIFVALLVFLTASAFLHNAYPRYFWIMVALGLAAAHFGHGARTGGAPHDRARSISHRRLRWTRDPHFERWPKRLARWWGLTPE